MQKNKPKEKRTKLLEMNYLVLNKKIALKKGVNSDDLDYVFLKYLN